MEYNHENEHGPLQRVFARACFAIGVPATPAIRTLGPAVPSKACW